MKPMQFICVLLVFLPTMLAADPHPMGLRNHTFNGSVQPVTEAGITRFEIRNQECSEAKYGDGRGESDCYNGNVRSTLSPHSVPTSGTWTYAFDFRVPGPVGYSGWHNSHACGYIDGCMDSRMRIASWEGNRLHNFLYLLKLDGRRGVYFLDQTCVEKEALENWNTFKMEVNWSHDERGWIRVSCNDEVIYFRENIRTTTNPHCYITNICQDSDGQRPSQVLTIIGPAMQGFGHEWKQRGKPHQFTDFYSDIVVEMRNVAFTRGGELYDPDTVRSLQTHLTDLGCDPGPIDGLMGGRTRQATLDCRDLGPATPSDAVDAATIEAWLAAYQEAFPATR